MVPRTHSKENEVSEWIYAGDVVGGLEIGDTYTVVKRDWKPDQLRGAECVGHRVVVEKTHPYGVGSQKTVLTTGKCECGNTPYLKTTCQITQVRKGGDAQDKNLRRLKKEGVVPSALQTQVTKTKDGYVGQIVLDKEIIWESRPYDEEENAEALPKAKITDVFGG